MKKTLLFAAMLATAFTAKADWEMMHEQSATYTFHITHEGLMLTSDFLDDRTGGIYISEDKGATWKKTNAKDFNYNRFYEFGDYVYAVGYSARIARSEDGGRTWDVLNYSQALKGLANATPSNIASSACYGLALHNGRLYASDFAFGVVASDDWGETWQSVDPASISYTVDDGGKGDGTMIETLYNIYEYNGTLVATGLYHNYTLDDNTGTWKLNRADSNNMVVATEFDGVLYCGRSMPNWDEKAPFLETTTDLHTWGRTNHPEGVIDNNVRAIYSDDRYIYVGLQNGGAFFTDDKGETWHDITLNMPHIEIEGYGPLPDMFLSPLTLISDDNYLYMALYNEPWNAAQHTSGTYRISKKELAGYCAGTSTVRTDTPAAKQGFDLSGRPFSGSHGLWISQGKKVMK